MKTSIKTLLFGAILVPCAFMFVGCGGNTTSAMAEFHNQSFQAASDFFVNEAYSSYKDITFTTTETVTEESTSSLTYKETAAAATTVTKSFTDRGVMTNTIEISRSGKAANAKIKVTVASEANGTNYTVSDTDSTLVTTTTFRTENSTYYFGIAKVENVDSLVYMEERTITEYTNTSTEAQKAPVTTKLYKVLSATAADNESNFVEQSEAFIANYLKEAFYDKFGNGPLPVTVTYSLNDKTATLSSNEQLSQLGESSSNPVQSNIVTEYDVKYFDTAFTISYTDNAMSNATQEITMKVKTNDSDEAIHTLANLDVTMTASAITLPAFTGFTLDANLNVFTAPHFDNVN